MKKIFLFLLSISLLNQLIAQSPVITANVGMPTGNANSRGVAYGNGVYVSILNSGAIYTSADGDSWTKANNASVPAGTFNSIAFGAGVFAVAGSNGLVFTSTNGINWVTRTSGTTQNLNDIQFIQSKFFILGNNATLRSSSDGITWSGITIGTGNSTDYFLNITYGNGAYAISARTINSGGIYIYRSTTMAANSFTLYNVAFGTINKVQYLKDKFFIFTTNGVFTSPDASTWTNSTASMIVTLPNSTTQNIGSPNQAFNGIYDGAKIYFYGSSQYYGGYGSIYSSSNGTNFTLEPKTAYIVCQGSAFINNKYFQYGNEGIISSANGLNYKYPSGNYNSLASNGGGYVAVGSVSTSGTIFTSADFNTWTEKTPANTKELNAVVYTGSKYVAAGNGTVLESTDGNTWSAIGGMAGETITNLAYNSGRLVAGSYNNASYAGKISYSANGVSWTTANTNDNSYFKIKYVNGNYFALGLANDTYLGKIMQSADGITWTDITPNLSFEVNYFNDVMYDGSKYYFMGMEYLDAANYVYGNFFSVSTASFSNPNSFANKSSVTGMPSGVKIGGTWGEGAFAYKNGHFTGAVVDIDTYQTYVVYSDDGINWTAVAQDAYTSIFGIVEEGSTFKMVGTGDGKITVAFPSTLPLDIVNISARKNNDQAGIEWQIANDRNVSAYVVENSIDLTNWQTIASVAPHSGSGLQSYQYYHTNPTKGMQYYRIKQKLADGGISFSKIVSVFFDGSRQLFSIFPNPSVNGTLNIRAAQALSMSLYNNSGVMVKQEMLKPGTQQLNVKFLPRGLYTAKIGNESTTIILQ